VRTFDTQQGSCASSQYDKPISRPYSNLAEKKAAHSLASGGGQAVSDVRWALVVDDEAVMLAIMRKIFEEQGF
jgi:hypothetical protein